MEHMKEVTRYQCQFCKKDFKTPDRHQCKFNPELKNCFTCKNLKGWNEGEEYSFGEWYGREPNIPDCVAIPPDMQDWNIESIKNTNYNMQCEKWKQGKYDWSQDYEEIRGLF
ncbi:hypothetical protein DW1_1119 [Proteiniborus sp. DW1]|uniref:hypothetical protein n=1 Tax=Proteiniborus sp. DW1 TaxID=1889883 RepID=UPI00092E0259|nr:hypothetical protein [Proteiniborus sp. DW1]SCG82692.1 hypothetical protein DW1_1119 [Proteiniborus sp. DW1]